MLLQHCLMTIGPSHFSLLIATLEVTSPFGDSSGGSQITHENMPYQAKGVGGGLQTRFLTQYHTPSSNSYWT